MWKAKLWPQFQETQLVFVWKGLTVLKLRLSFSFISNRPGLSQCSEDPGRAPVLHQCRAPPPGQMWTSAGCQTPRSALWWLPSPDGSVNRQGNKKVVCLPPGSSLLLGIHKHSSVFLQISFMIWATTCSGSLSCSRPLCLSVVWRILTSSTGLQDDRRGISSKSLSTKLSWRWGSSVRNNLRGQKTWTEGECFYFCYEGSKWKQKPTKTPGVFWGFSLSASKIYNSCNANWKVLYK